MCIAYNFRQRQSDTISANIIKPSLCDLSFLFLLFVLASLPTTQMPPPVRLYSTDNHLDPLLPS